MSHVPGPVQRRRVAAAPPAPWEPGDAGTILYQVDAEASSVLWQDTGASTPATTGGDPIRRWNALTGGDLTQSTAGAEPQLVLSSGKKRVRCDGSNDRITNASQSFSAGAKSLAFCWQYTSTPGTSEVDYLALFGLPASGGISRIVMAGSSHPSAGLNFNCDAPGSSTTLVGASSVLPDTSLHAAVLTYNGGTITDAASYRLWVDGVEKTVATRASALTPSGTTSAGALSNGNNPATADLMHALVWSGAISETDAIEACSYLLARHAP